MISLGRLYLYNFKSFEEPLLFDLSNKDLILLDGPNGYGKTTIFDALELCFRSDISRIIPTDGKNKTKHVLKNKDNEETIICLEIKSSDEEYAIHISIPSNLNPKQKRIEKNDKFKISRLILKNFPEQYSTIGNIHSQIEDKELTALILSKDSEVNAFLEEKLQYKNVIGTFNIFNYIQQEDTTHFLKINEKERHQKIGYLFGTANEKNELDKIEKTYKELSAIISGKEQQYKNLEDELNSLVSFNSNEQEGLKSSGKIKKIEELKNIKLEQSTTMLESYRLSLGNIKNLIINSKEYQYYIHNRQLEKIIHNENLLTNFIYLGVFNNYSDVKHYLNDLGNKKEEVLKHEFFIKKINDYQELDNLNEENIQEYFKYFSSNKGDIDTKIALLKQHENSTRSYEKIVVSLTNALETLKNAYKNFISHDHKEDILCPFCGTEKLSVEILLKEYESQYNEFQSLLSQTGRNFADLNSKIKEQYLEPIITSMKSLTKEFNYPKPFMKILEKRSINEKYWNDLSELKKWLISNEVNFKSLLFPEDIDDSVINTIDEKLKNLINMLSSMKRSTSIEFNIKELEHDLNLFDIKFDKIKEIFLSNNQVLSEQDLDSDIQFVRFLEFKINNEQFKQKKSKHDKILKDISKLNVLSKELKEIKDIYLENLKEYEKNVAINVAIPFYIYSAKILQTRLEGSGVFIDTAIDETRSDANNFIRFKTSVSDDQDAWNTMSSGQLSGVVIAFMLAMNKVYPTKLQTLMIDDPVQTMDEINMVSLLQLLRYEFNNYQLIMSTHVPKVSDYFKYKYETFKKNVKCINVKERRYQPEN